jgi:RND family efflux transporter MFP subunit
MLEKSALAIRRRLRGSQAARRYPTLYHAKLASHGLRNGAGQDPLVILNRKSSTFSAIRRLLRNYTIAMRISLITSVLLLAACSGEHKTAAAPTVATFVIAAKIEPAVAKSYELTGVVRARQEALLAFRLPGEIRQRLVRAGDQVKAGQVLMVLDPRDAEQQLVAARTQAETAQASRQRLTDLRNKNFISQQALDNAVSSASSAQAAMVQAQNATSYTRLVAPAAGTLMEVTGEVGQVVVPGQTVATLAYAGEREVEVFIPEIRLATLSKQALARLFGSTGTSQTTLREVAGVADSATRTWRARYRLADEAANWPLGTTASLILNTQETSSSVLKRVPVAAVLDKGQGTMVWVIREGKAVPTPVKLMHVDNEYAVIATDLTEGTPVVALGLHVLKPGQAVKIRP